MWWLKERRKRENKREKEGDGNPIMRDHPIKTPYQLVYLPKALLLNTITLGVKGGHN